MSRGGQDAKLFARVSQPLFHLTASSFHLDVYAMLHVTMSCWIVVRSSSDASVIYTVRVLPEYYLISHIEALYNT